MKSLWKKDLQEPIRGDDSQITYGSMVIILVTIFMMVMSYSRIERGKMAGTLNELGNKKILKSFTAVTGSANPSDAKIDSLLESVRKIVKGRIPEEHMSLERTRTGIRAVIAGSYFFSSASLQIRREASLLLDEMASVIRATQFVLGVVGCDSRKSASSEEARLSLVLTASRANMIMRHLMEKDSFLGCGNEDFLCI